MTPKERLQRIFDGEAPDRPACICPGGMMNMITTELMERARVFLPEAHTSPELMARLSRAVYEEGCFENCGVPFCMTVEAEVLGARVDMGSAIHEPHVTGYVIDSVCDWEKLVPGETGQGREQVVLDAIRILKEGNQEVPVIGNLTGPVSTATSVMEPVNFYKELRKKNAEAHAYMEFITGQLIRFGRAQIEAGADVIAISDPSGTGEIMGPRFFREFTVHYLNMLLDGLQQKKLGTIVHICGQMHSVYPEIAKVKSSALSFDSIVPMREAREHLPDRVLMGNVSTYALEFGKPERIRTMAASCRKNGADILAPACGLGMRSPIRNVQAILQSLTEEA